MATEHPLDDLADAILDGSPIDWSAAESKADENARPLLDPLKLLATLADVHRHPPLPHSRLTVSGSGEQSEAGDDGVADLSGDMIGVYRLIEPLGRGGMGEVYIAERADGRFDLKVAVKLVKRGKDTAEILRRFVRERRILARLDHPGVARLFDAGETIDGRPYFVMELVEGEPITAYCRNRRLSIDDRLRLLASCCDAVDAAHRGLVVHGDLKPSNVFVTSDGQVKLLDFGIATLLAEDQEARDNGQLTRVLTPGYAAPEQILGGGVAVATDVFSLGVVLYELLTGALPYDRRATSSSDLSARVERENAELPSAVANRTAQAAGVDQKRERWARSLRGDVDAITMKALAHEPARRYLSAAAFAEDVRRHLASRPVEAHPDSRGYKLRKFLIRHRHGVAAASVVVAALIAALAVSLVQISTSRREADRAAAAQAFLTSLFTQIDPDRYVGSAPSVRDLLERGSERLDLELAQQPELQAEMQVTLAWVFDQLSLFDRGEAHWRRALETRRTLFGSGDARTLKTAKGLAISLARQGRYGESELLFQQLLEHESVLADARETGSVLLNYGNVKRITGNYDAAQALLERAVPLLESAGEPARQSLANALHNLGLLHRQTQRGKDAVVVLERALAIQMQLQGPQSRGVATAKTLLSDVSRDLGDLDAAERYAHEALTVLEALMPPTDPFIAHTLAALGQLAHKRGDRARARTLYERSIASYEGADRPGPGFAHPLRYLASLSREEGATEQALRLYERALAVKRKHLGDRHREVAEFWHELARGRLAHGDVSGSLEALNTGVNIFRETLPADSPQLAGGLFLLGDVLRLNDHPSDALPYLEEAHAIWRHKPPPDPKSLTDLETALAAIRAVR